MDDTSVQYAISAIRRFLAARPDSTDTLQGVHEWWIQWPTLDAPSLTTLTALEQLESEGFLERFQVGSRVLWRRKH
jgi:hypothetical protein